MVDVKIIVIISKYYLPDLIVVSVVSHGSAVAVTGGGGVGGLVRGHVRGVVVVVGVVEAGGGGRVVLGGEADGVGLLLGGLVLLQADGVAGQGHGPRLVRRHVTRVVIIVVRGCRGHAGYGGVVAVLGGG